VKPGRRASVLAALAAGLWGRAAAGFQLEGHEVIEAAAYKRLLAMDVVPGTEVSGRVLLGTLMATGVLARPRCFDRDRPRGDCGPAARLELPLAFWPVLGSGAPDLVIDRQLGQRGQCQHFMARTEDSLGPVDPRFDVPVGLATTAYDRCVRVAGNVFDGILRDPYLMHWRVSGTYVLLHAIADSFSAAHADRDARLRIVHLMSWTLIDWPVYAAHVRWGFPAGTHHAVSDERDNDYARWDARAPDGRSCRSFRAPYAFPEACLTARARAAVDAFVAFLVMTYDLRTRAAAEGRPASLFGPAAGTERAAWAAFVNAHLASAAAPAALPLEPVAPLPRPDLFLGVQGTVGPGGSLGVGAWAARFFFVKPVIPFVLAVTASAGYVRADGASHLSGGVNVGLLLPLVRRLSIGGAPAGVRVACDTGLDDCTAELTATLGELLIPLGAATWLGVSGPQWSWTDRRWRDVWVGLQLGWSHEGVRRPAPPSAGSIAAWDPPRVDEVRAFRLEPSTRAFYLATTAGSQPDNAFVGLGFDWRRDRDVWGRRAGFAPGLQAELDYGTIDGPLRGGSVALAPTGRVYLVTGRVSLAATPALTRFGVLANRPVAFDVAARAGIALDVGGIELSVDSPPLSYVSTSRWHTLPFTVRLGTLID
jgi:hypothetical protein